MRSFPAGPPLAPPGCADFKPGARSPFAPPPSRAPAAPRPQLERHRIGRVKASNNTLVVKDPSVSQKHAEIVWSGVAWEITDLGSSNGTWVNSEELAQDGARRPHVARASA